MQSSSNMESLKENLRNAVEVHKQNAAAGDFSCGSLLSHIDLPNAPSISINNYGILPYTSKTYTEQSHDSCMSKSG